MICWPSPPFYCIINFNDFFFASNLNLFVKEPESVIKEEYLDDDVAEDDPGEFYWCCLEFEDANGPPRRFISFSSGR